MNKENDGKVQMMTHTLIDESKEKPRESRFFKNLLNMKLRRQLTKPKKINKTDLYSEGQKDFDRMSLALALKERALIDGFEEDN